MARSRQYIEQIQFELHQHLKNCGDEWIPKQPIWLNTPAILPGEALSSWLTRITLSAKISQQKLLSTLGANCPSYLVDCGLLRLNLDAITRLTKVDTTEFPFLEWLSSSPLNHVDFACLTSDILGTAPIYQFCPVCLKEDERPYFRQLWRFSFGYVCPSHHCLLHRLCPHCQEPIDITKFVRNKQQPLNYQALRFCPNCNFNLGFATVDFASQRSTDLLLSGQNRMWNLVMSIHCDRPQSAIHSQIRRYLRWSKAVIQLPSHKYEERWTAIGVDAASLFGPSYFDIALELIQAHRLPALTYWWRDDTDNHLHSVISAIYPNQRAVQNWLKKFGIHIIAGAT